MSDSIQKMNRRILMANRQARVWMNCAKRLSG